MESTTRLHMFSSCQGDNHLLFMYTCYILGDDEATIYAWNPAPLWEFMSFRKWPCNFLDMHDSAWEISSCD